MTKLGLVLTAACVATSLAGIAAQTGTWGTNHRGMAAQAAGQYHPGLLAALCPAPQRGQAAGRGQAPPAAGRGAAPAAVGQVPAGSAQPNAIPTPRTPPAREQWHAEPVKVFDNLYWLGQTEYSVWAVTTSAGIIVIDTIYDYSVQDEVVDGMRKMGLDPNMIKYAIVSHGHSDHSGGAKLLQDEFKTQVLMSAADWDLLDRGTGTRPKKELVITDGQKLTLGDTTLTLYITPGHTAGTVSTLIPVKDKGTPHVLAEWGGTLIGGLRTREAFQTYIDSAVRFREIVKEAKAEGIISNHTNYDGSKFKLPMVLARKPGDAHPYLTGNDAVQRYLTVAEECAKAGQADLPTQP